MTKEKEDLVIQNLGLSYYVAHKFKSSGIEWDDLVSIAQLGMIKAADAYDPDKDIKFGTFAAIVIRYEILQELRRIRKQSKYFLTVSLNEMLPGSEHPIERWELIPDDHDPFEHIENQVAVKQMLAGISNRDRWVLYLIMAEQISQQEVSKMLGVSQSYVSRLVRQTCAQIRKGELCKKR